VKEKNIHFGKSIIVDSTDIDAQTNHDIDDTNKKGGADNDAAWGAKGGDKPNEPYYWYGYKMHSAVEAKEGLFLYVKTTPANVADNQCFKKLVTGSMEMVTRVKKAAADRGYDDGDLFEWLKEEKIRCAIRMKDQRLKHPAWKKLSQQPWYKASLHERYKIERSQAWAKNSHRLQKSRAISLKKTNIFCWLVALAVNMKRLLKLLFNITLNAELRRKPCLA
jgi:IS5 family transposase